MSDKFGVTLSYCTNCGADEQLPVEEKTVAFSKTVSPAAKTKSSLPTILVTSFFTSFFLIALFAGGAYWFINRSPVTSSISNSIQNADSPVPKLTPRRKNRSAISAPEITKIESSETATTTRASAAQYFGNVNPNNFTTRTSTVSLFADGKAVKVVGESGTMNGVQMSPTPQQYTGAITREKFAELAQILVENDFLGEEDSKTSTSLPVSYTLTISYSSGEKKIKMSNSGKDTPEADAMRQAVKNAENSVGWKK